MRTIHSVGGGRSPKSLCDDGTQYQTKYTDKQFGDGYKTLEKDDMDESFDDKVAELPLRPRGA